MKLEHGKTYLDRAGNRVTVEADHEPDAFYQFTGVGDGFWYSADGRLYDDRTTPHDLVAEAGPEPEAQP